MKSCPQLSIVNSQLPTPPNFFNFKNVKLAKLIFLTLTPPKIRKYTKSENLGTKNEVI